MLRMNLNAISLAGTILNENRNSTPFYIALSFSPDTKKRDGFSLEIAYLR